MYEHLSHLNVAIYITNKMPVYSTPDMPRFMKTVFTSLLTTSTEQAYSWKPMLEAAAPHVLNIFKKRWK